MSIGHLFLLGTRARIERAVAARAIDKPQAPGQEKPAAEQVPQARARDARSAERPVRKAR